MGAERDRASGRAGTRTARLAGLGSLPIAAGAVAVLAAGAAAVLLALGGGSGARRQPVPAAPVDAVQAVESGSAVRAADGGVWSPDAFSQGGHLVASRVSIAHTHSEALYQSQRVGIRSIDVPIRSNGSYLVVLYFAEAAGAAPGTRTFDVLAQDRLVATVDIAAEVGALTPYHLAFTASVSRHLLGVRFRSRRGEPTLSAIRVTRADPEIQLPAGRLVWSDEFNGPRGTRPDPANWRYDLGSGWGQDAIYTDEAANASLDGRGRLVLAARNETQPGTRAGRPTSARITTRGLHEMRYGAASARLRVVGEPGVVSTFWALGSDVERVGWPGSGEIDPLEVRGVQPSVLIQALHMPCASTSCGVVWERAMPASLAASYHTVTVERAPGVVIYLLDGRQLASLTAADVQSGAWVFDKPFFLILNVIVGGWAGEPTAATRWPLRMSVDWVRLFA